MEVSRWSERTQKKKRASWRYGRAGPGPAEANRGGRLGREYDVVDGQTKGARYTAETQYSGRFAMEVTTRPHGQGHGGVMVRSGVEGSTEYGEECCQEGNLENLKKPRLVCEGRGGERAEGGELARGAR